MWKRAKLVTLVLVGVLTAWLSYPTWRSLVLDDSPETWNREQLEVVYKGDIPMQLRVELIVSYTASSDPDQSDRGRDGGTLRVVASNASELQPERPRRDTAIPDDSDLSDTSDIDPSPEPVRPPGLAVYLYASPRIARVLDACIAAHPNYQLARVARGPTAPNSAGKELAGQPIGVYEYRLTDRAEPLECELQNTFWIRSVPSTYSFRRGYSLLPSQANLIMTPARVPTSASSTATDQSSTTVTRNRAIRTVRRIRIGRTARKGNTLR